MEVCLCIRARLLTHYRQFLTEINSRIKIYTHISALVNRFFFLVLGEIRSTGTAMVSRRILETSGTMSGAIWCVSSLSGATKKTCSINSWVGEGAHLLVKDESRTGALHAWALRCKDLWQPEMGWLWSFCQALWLPAAVLWGVNNSMHRIYMKTAMPHCGTAVFLLPFFSSRSIDYANKEWKVHLHQ